MWWRQWRITLDACIGRGYVLVGWRRPDRSEVERWSVDAYMGGRNMKKKKAVGTVATVKHLAPMETHVMAQYMPLVEHMAMTQYEDGDSRRVGRITLCTFGSTWQAEVKDPDTLQMMRVNAPTLDELLLLVAALLSSEDAPWEPDVWAQQQSRKNKK
jgi:hypothetical protein